MASEHPEAPALDYEPATGAAQSLQDYKQDGRIKKQAVRFRIFEYDNDASDATPVREVTSDDAQITWTVALANKKASAPRLRGGGLRNPSVADRATLEITPKFASIGGNLQHANEHTSGMFLGKTVSLGELHTDDKGRLIVVGGNGDSEDVDGSADSGEPLDFADNNGWHDDVSDGPIDATITLPGEAPVDAVGSWVIFAPPDFAPENRAIKTLYDVAEDIADSNAPNPVNFDDHVRPMFERGRLMADVVHQDFIERFRRIPDDMEALSALPGDALVRRRAKRALDGASRRLQRFSFSDRQLDILDEWETGNFQAGSGITVAAGSPLALDIAALDQTVGGGFFPGIEAGIIMENSQLYDMHFIDGRASPRIDRNSPLGVGPGFLSARMALPWQADFLKCGRDPGGLWWPVQRPDGGLLDANDPASHASWVSPIGGLGHQDVIRNLHRLGFIRKETIDDEPRFVERERDPTFLRP